MRVRRVAGILSFMAVLAAASLGGATFSFFSSARPNPSNQFRASPDFSAPPPNGSSHDWSGFADFSVGLSGTVPAAIGPGSLVLAATSTDQQTAATAGSLTTTAPGALAQTFQPSADQVLGRVDLVLSTVGPGPVDDLTVSIRATTAGVPSGPDLAEATISPSSLSLTPTNVSAVFSAPPTLTGGASYAIVLRGDATSWSLGSAYAPGLAFVSADATTFAPSGGDLAFSTHPASGGPYVLSGTQTSDVVDLGTATDQFLTLSFTGTGAGGALRPIRFQVAASNVATDTAASTFLGPDGDPAQFYETTVSTLWNGLNGKRFLRYRAFLETADPTQTPVLSTVRISWDGEPDVPSNLTVAGPPAAPSLSWTATDPDAGDTLTFLLQIAADPGYTNLVENRVRLRTPDFTVSGPVPSATYYWRVAAFDGVLYSPWSPSATFTVS